MIVTTVGIGLAKNVSSVHGVDSHGKVVLKKTVSRSKLLKCFVNLPPAIICMEACGGARRGSRILRSEAKRRFCTSALMAALANTITNAAP